MKIIRVVFILFLCSQFMIAENKIISFNGGRELIDLTFQSRLFSESDIGNLNFGNTNSSLLLSAAQFRTNPAVLGFINKSSFSIDLNPGFDINGISVAEMSLGKGEFTKTINESVISGLDGSGMAGDLFVDDKTEFNENNSGMDMMPFISQKRSINGASAIIAPSKYGSFGISQRSLYDLNLGFIMGGLNMTIEDKDITGDSPTTVKLPLTIDLGMNLGINFDETDFAYGIDMGQVFSDADAFGKNATLSMGIGFNYLKGKISNNAIMTINGMIRQISDQADITAYFNDPAATFRNTLNDSINIDFSGNALKPTFGLSYKRGSFNFDFSYLGSAIMKMDGELYIVTHNMGALNMGYDEDGADNILGDTDATDGVDTSADDEVMFDMFQLKPSALTYTNRVVYRSNTFEINYPSKIALSIGYKNRSEFFKMVFGVGKTFGNFSILYECDISEDGEKKEGSNFVTFCPEEGKCDEQSEVTRESYELTTKQIINIQLGLGLGRFYMGGSVALGDFQIKGLLDKEGKQKEPLSGIPVSGSFGMGLNLSLTKNTTMDISLISFPGLSGFTTLTYKF